MKGDVKDIDVNMSNRTEILLSFNNSKVIYDLWRTGFGRISEIQNAKGNFEITKETSEI